MSTTVRYRPLKDSTIHKAVALWFSNRDRARQVYGPIETWDVSQVTNMVGLFRGQKKFNEDIGGWDVSHVTDMSEMLDGATSFNQRLDRWNVANLQQTDTTPLAVVLLKLKNLAFDIWWEVLTMAWEPLTDATIHEAVKMWCTSPDEVCMQYGPIELWDVRQVTNMDRLFQGQSDFTNDISRWDVKNVTSMRGMFAGASSFNAPIGGWDVRRVTDMGKSIFQSITCTHCTECDMM